jgi:hypothetical protein
MTAQAHGAGKMRHVISIGGGLSSTMELPERVIAQHGRDCVDLVMCRLPNEDPDVWRLVEAVEQRLDVEVQMIGLNLTPWDIFFQSRMLGNSRIDPCSRRLKREQLLLHMTANYDPADTVMHVGITYGEIDRMLAIAANWNKNGWKIDAPLADDKSITRESLMAKSLALFQFIPRLYLMGMSHNNCGGACIKAGQAQWARLLWFLPDVYDWWEVNEAKFRETIGEYTILSEGRVKRPMTLREFRLKMQARWRDMLPGFDPFDGLEETPACVSCEAA